MFLDVLINFCFCLVGSTFFVGTVYIAAQIGRLVHRFVNRPDKPLTHINPRKSARQLPPSLARELHQIGARLAAERNAS